MRLSWKEFKYAYSIEITKTEQTLSIIMRCTYPKKAKSTDTLASSL
jgi:hypothetical protein